MKTRTAPRVALQGLIACACCAWITTAAQAQVSGSAERGGVSDPTRPPTTQSAAAATGPLAPRSGSAASNTTAREAPRPPPAPRLQSVHLPHNGAASALVDGRLLRVGERLDDWQVERIELDGLMLRATTKAPGTTPAIRERWLPLLPATSALNRETPSADRPQRPEPAPPQLARNAARKEP